MSFSSELRIHSYCSSTACSRNEKLCDQISYFTFWTGIHKKAQFLVGQSSGLWIPRWIIRYFNLCSTLATITKAVLMTIYFEKIFLSKFFAGMVLFVGFRTKSSSEISNSTIQNKIMIWNQEFSNIAPIKSKFKSSIISKSFSKSVFSVTFKSSSIQIKYFVSTWEIASPLPANQPVSLLRFWETQKNY